MSDRDRQLRSVARGLLALGVLAGLAAVIVGLGERQQFFRSYLFAWTFWLGLPMGALIFAMIHPLVGGGWGFAVRPVLLACARTLPLIGLLVLPVFWGLAHLYPWAQPNAGALDPVIAHKLGYMNAPFFMVRTVAYLVAFTLLAFVVARWSEDYRPGDEAAPNRLRALCAFGIVFVILVESFAAVDWTMSLEKDYYSTVYGFIYLAAQSLMGLCFAVAVTTLVLGGVQSLASPRKPAAKVSRDLGSLIATNVLVWAYVQFAQLIVNWSGDMKNEIGWYLNRQRHGWGVISALLVAAAFGAPFFVLLFRSVKDNGRRLGAVAAFLVVIHILDIFWLVVPSYGDPLSLHWLDVLLFVGIGGLWGGLFLMLLLRQLARRGLVVGRSQPGPAVDRRYAIR